jgi:Flp pilus assembly pilin Flp
MKKGGSRTMKFLEFLKGLHQEESGQDLLEYALVLLAVLAAVVAGSQSLATDISTALTSINTKIQNAIAGA